MVNKTIAIEYPLSASLSPSSSPPYSLSPLLSPAHAPYIDTIQNCQCHSSHYFRFQHYDHFYCHHQHHCLHDRHRCVFVILTNPPLYGCICLVKSIVQTMKHCLGYLGNDMVVISHNSQILKKFTLAEACYSNVLDPLVFVRIRILPST